ncbi:Potassium channel subfamily K member 10 [Araneus ventricosus]|uniref:Potassium channel subfamily K member 10 n=1 Tax=Araneus ventricosus TaxID=182803 RepID=A0A4Y2E122_ARAVE|nr:Potassium channel subfamily K member 10 [Araneus ventricosus]
MLKIPLIGFKREVFSMLIIYIGYLSLGALIFVAVEADNEEYARNVSMSKSQLIRSMMEVLREENFTDRQIFESLNHRIQHSNDGQNITWKNVFGEKFIFSMVLITTIGYGNVRPKSSWGKYACIIYALFGIPLHLTFMRLISLQFRAGLRKVIKNSEKLMNTVFVDSLAITVYFVFFTTLLVFIPAIVFNTFETWSYLESVYYSFVTLSTIGLGDYVASVGSRYHNSKYYFFHVLLMFAWLLLGVTFIAMCLTLLSYLLGLLILDKLDCRCYKRSAAWKGMASIYGCTSELNWQLAKQKPQNFTKWKVIENFQDICVENPQDVTKGTLIDVLDALEELKETIYEDTSLLDVSKKSRSKVVSRTDYDDAVPKSGPKRKSPKYLKADQKNVYKSAKDWKPPTIGSVLNEMPSSSKSNESTQTPESLIIESMNSEKQSSLKSDEESISSEHSNDPAGRTEKAKSLTVTNIDQEILDLRKTESSPNDRVSEKDRAHEK